MINYTNKKKTKKVKLVFVTHVINLYLHQLTIKDSYNV